MCSVINITLTQHFANCHSRNLAYFTTGFSTRFVAEIVDNMHYHVNWFGTMSLPKHIFRGITILKMIDRDYENSGFKIKSKIISSRGSMK